MTPVARVAIYSLAIGVAITGTMLLLDQFLFAGVSLPRIRSSADLPLWMRALLPVYAAVTEEIIYRLGIMTLVVWFASFVIRERGASLPVAIWVGIGIAAVLFGLAHVANVPNATSPVLRAVVLNGFAGTILGWWYWKSGFEAAVLAHFGADVFIYLVVASLL